MKALLNPALLYASVLALGLSACSFKNDETKQKEAAKASAEVLNQYEQNQDQKKQTQRDGGKLTDENVSVEFMEMEQAGLYKMLVKWPASIPVLTIQVDDEFETTTEQKNFHERIVQSGKTYRIRLTSKTFEGIEISRKELIKSAPVDFTVTSDMSLKSNTTIESNRFYIYPNTQILTNGFDLNIKTNKLILGQRPEQPNGSTFLNNASIITALPGQIAKDSAQLQGSKITIIAKQATGHLKVALVGLDGPDGRNGSELDQLKNLVRTLDSNLNGRQGNPGKVGDVRVPCPRGHNMDIACEPTQQVCQQPPQNGEDGKQGAAGTDGEMGQNGGNSGTLFVRIDNPDKFSIEVGQQAGRAGHGGQGGPGSPGGLGGKAGKNPGPPCLGAQDGAPGKSGSVGSNGPSGQPGKLGTVDTIGIPTTVFAL